MDQLKEEGQWQQLVLFEKTFKNERGCNLAPKTCKLIEKWMSDTAVSCSRGQVKFSVMHKDTHVWPHSGPTNTRYVNLMFFEIKKVNTSSSLKI